MGCSQLTFDDLLLNPSVESNDEYRLSRQAERIVRLFVKARHGGRMVSNTELMEVARQYQARLFEVRRFLTAYGFCIDLVRREANGLNYYCMVPIDESTFYRDHQDTFRRNINQVNQSTL